MSDEDCRELITQGLLLNFTDVDAHSFEAWALLSPETRGDGIVAHSPEEDQTIELGGQRGRLVWVSGTGHGNSGRLGYYVIAFWVVIVGFLACWLCSSSRNSRLRRRAYKRRSSR